MDLNLLLIGLAVIAGLAVLLVIALVVRVMSGRVRGREGPRLAVLEYQEVDKLRRLVLIRRDNVEHLLLLGGGRDLVVEAGINVRPSAGQPAGPEAARVTAAAPRLAPGPGAEPSLAMPAPATSAASAPTTSALGWTDDEMGRRAGAPRPSPALSQSAAPAPVAQPQVTQPQGAQPQVAQPQVPQPQRVQPQPPHPQMAQPQRAQPQAAQPHAAQSVSMPDRPEQRPDGARPEIFDVVRLTSAPNRGARDGRERTASIPPVQDEPALPPATTQPRQPAGPFYSGGPSAADRARPSTETGRMAGLGGSPYLEPFGTEPEEWSEPSQPAMSIERREDAGPAEPEDSLRVPVAAAFESNPAEPNKMRLSDVDGDREPPMVQAPRSGSASTFRLPDDDALHEANEPRLPQAPDAARPPVIRADRSRSPLSRFEPSSPAATTVPEAPVNIAPGVVRAADPARIEPSFRPSPPRMEPIRPEPPRKPSDQRPGPIAQPKLAVVRGTAPGDQRPEPVLVNDEAGAKSAFDDQELGAAPGRYERAAAAEPAGPGGMSWAFRDSNSDRF